MYANEAAVAPKPGHLPAANRARCITCLIGNFHGQKVFRPASYRRLFAEDANRFPIRHHQNYGAIQVRSNEKWIYT